MYSGDFRKITGKSWGEFHPGVMSSSDVSNFTAEFEQYSHLIWLFGCAALTSDTVIAFK